MKYLRYTNNIKQNTRFQKSMHPKRNFYIYLRQKMLRDNRVRGVKIKYIIRKGSCENIADDRPVRYPLVQQRVALDGEDPKSRIIIFGPLNSYYSFLPSLLSLESYSTSFSLFLVGLILFWSGIFNTSLKIVFLKL